MKKWMSILLVLAVALLVPILVAVFWPHPKEGTPTPPPGPHKAGDVWVADLGGKTTMEMVWCPPGKFLMGSPTSEKGRDDNETLHEVTLTKGFWLGKYEVTQAQWSTIMGNNPSYFPEKTVVHWEVWEWQIPVWQKNFMASRWQLPVDHVNWDDCQNFCRKVDGACRLPTEAEWEYACRAGSTGPFAGTGVLKELGWYRDNSDTRTHPVGRKKPNVWGLCDMHGNVWEWCQDYYGGDYPAGTATDPTGPATGANRVYRGGSWIHPSGGCRAAARGKREPVVQYKNLGFRVVLDPATQQ